MSSVVRHKLEDKQGILNRSTCGLVLYQANKFTSKWAQVTCKRCLAARGKKR